MTGYQKDVLRQHSEDIRDALIDTGKFAGENTVKILAVFDDLVEEYLAERIQREIDLRKDIAQDRNAVGKLVKSTDPDKAAVVAEMKRLSRATKITNVKETQYWYKGVPHHHISGTKEYSKGEPVLLRKITI